MPQHEKISEFTIRAREELAHRANDNAPPESMEVIHELMRAVLHPTNPPLDSFGTDRPLNDRERWAINCLIECHADDLGVLARLTILAVEIAFEVEDLTELRASQYDAIISYLVRLPGGRS